jgi:hypothetical protein
VAVFEQIYLFRFVFLFCVVLLNLTDRGNAITKVVMRKKKKNYPIYRDFRISEVSMYVEIKEVWKGTEILFYDF